MVHGWLRSFWRLEDDCSPDQIWVFFDKGGSRRRENILPSYKANRGLPPDGFSEQLDWVKRLTTALGYGWREQEGLEADDLIASAVCQRSEDGTDLLVVSSDKDLCQLVGPKVKQLLPPPTANPKLGWRLLDESGVKEKFGVSPSGILDYLSIIGDQSDNIPGLPGVGPKTALKWMKEYGDLEGIIENAGRLSPKRFCSLVYERKGDLLRNRELIRLESDLEVDVSNCPLVNLTEMKEILLELEMKKSWEEASRRYG